MPDRTHVAAISDGGAGGSTAAMTPARLDPGSSRVALLAFLGIIWLNVLTTSRWAGVPGSVYGPKRWIFFPLLVLTTVLALRPARPAESLHGWSRIAGIGGVLVLAGSFFVWFPPATWTQVPFLDNWPARYQATLDGLNLYRHGVAAGWEWRFLGGYHSSSDVTVTLSALAALPIASLAGLWAFTRCTCSCSCRSRRW